ncbi:Transmembrane protein 97 [Batrachochytrium dendrobatidis]|nr:Transmembrane protein 97 [Batrachochytrium dendrobatidis]
MSSHNTSFMHRPLDMLFAIFFSLGLFPAIIFASQVALSPDLRSLYIPQSLQTLLVSAVASTHDPLISMALGNREMWVASIFTAELVLQAPFFLFAIVALSMNWHSWFRFPAIIYSVHVLTTMIPIYAELLWGRQEFIQALEMSEAEVYGLRLQWAGIYSPFIIMPTILLIKWLFFYDPTGSAGQRLFALAPGSMAKANLHTKKSQ